MLRAGITTADPFTRLHVIAMQIQGLWPVVGLGRKAAFLHRSFGVLITIFYGFFTATMFVDAFISRDNLEALTGNLNISLLYCSGIVKATAHIFTRDTFLELVKHSDQFYRRIRRSGDPRASKILEEYIRYANIVTFIFWIAVAFTITGFCGAPIIDVIAGTKDEPSRLIFRAWNPFPDLWSGYVLQLLMIYLTGIITASWSTLISVLIIIPTCEIRILNLEMEEMTKDRDTRTPKDRNIGARTANWVKNHLKVVRYVETLNGALNHLLLLDFVVYSVIYCTTFFQYIVLGIGYEIFVAFFYMLAMMNQLLIVYWTGNEIKIYSESLAEAAFNSSWYGASASYKTSVKIIMLRCQKPLTLRVWKLYDVSMATFLKITSAAYSYFAILRHIYLKK